MRHLILALLVLFQQAQAAEETRRNPRLVEMPAGRWLLLHEQGPDDDPIFKRQAHAGACFDSRRGRIVIFGSDTHGRDWTNSPLFFDVATERWMRAYQDDPRSSYAVDERGLPVAGAHGRHPWAMHTFGVLICDAARDELVVASMPVHMVPGRFSNSLEGLWERVGRHPSWTFDLKGRKWWALDGEAVHFFACTPKKDGAKQASTETWLYELAADGWQQLPSATLPFACGMNYMMVYDPGHEALLLVASDELIEEVERADVIALGTPMYNYGMPAALKAWFDQVIRVHRTFTFDLARGDWPLAPTLSGKTLVVTAARGEFEFAPGGIREAWNHLETHIATCAHYLGVAEPHLIAIEYQEFGGERHRESRADAFRSAARLSEQLAGLRACVEPRRHGCAGA